MENDTKISTETDNHGVSLKRNLEDVNSNEDGPTLSKRQQKKLVKLRRQEEHHQQRKLQLKEKRREEQAIKRKEKDNTWEALTENEKEEKRRAALEKKRLRDEAQAALLAKLKHANEHAPKIIIDLDPDFWDKMNYQEQKSLVSQLAFCVGCNKRCSRPCSLHFTSFDGGVEAAALRQFPGCASWNASCHSAPLQEAAAFKDTELVYLTADAETELSELKAGYGYIIGGIVDRNRFKSLCLDKALKLGIKVMRLPIGEHLKLAGSKVLTVNQTVAILCSFMETKDWHAACNAVVPLRKTADHVTEAPITVEDHEAHGADVPEKVT